MSLESQLAASEQALELQERIARTAPCGLCGGRHRTDEKGEFLVRCDEAKPAPIVAAARLVLDEAKHEYSIGGVVLPSVTQILENVGIIDYGFLPDAEREHYMRRGRIVHKATHFDDEGDLQEETLREEYRGYVAAWRKARTLLRATWERIEWSSWHELYRYAGTQDRYGAVEYGNVGSKARRTVLDIKTGHSPEWVRYQLAAYAAFHDKPIALRRMAIELHEDGTFGVTEYPCGTFLSDFQVFLAALTVFNAKRR